jgi:hypothetical protein
MPPCFRDHDRYRNRYAEQKGEIEEMPVSPAFQGREAEFRALLVRLRIPTMIEMLETAKEIGASASSRAA